MKAIIIDDEKHVREAIKLLVPWNDYGITNILEAQDGQQATEMIAEHRPQIIFTDMMMPLMDGVQLLQWLQSDYPLGKTIVISGFDDFQLVRHTVQYGGIDYILKPIDADQLQSALSKAVDSWRKEEQERLRQQQRNMEMNQIRPVYWDKMLSNFITDPRGFESSFDVMAKQFGLTRDIKECRLAIISLDTMNSQLRLKFDSNLDLIFFSITNICNEFLHESAQGVAYRYWNSDNEIILLLYGSESVERLLSDIQQGIWTAIRGCFDIGLSTVQPFPLGLPVAYSEAKLALRRRNLLLKEKQLHDYKGQSALQTQQLSFSDFAEPIRLSVRSGSTAEIRKSVEAWVEAVAEMDSVSIEDLEHWYHEYTVHQSRWLNEWFGDRPHSAQLTPGASPFILPLNDDGYLSLELWREHLIASMTELSASMLEHQKQDSHTIFEIAKYIQNHYHQDITLLGIANHFYLSREYISRKFKQQFQVNLSDYLSNLRVDKAKLLLLNPHLKIAQIANMVGYEDEKYFSKVFKKWIGLSPNEYRKVNQP